MPWWQVLVWLLAIPATAYAILEYYIIMRWVVLPAKLSTRAETLLNWSCGLIVVAVVILLVSL